jgi:creatinine amidohydrolase/Fe(II)-dependent formamide hydrolase-like protein
VIVPTGGTEENPPHGPRQTQLRRRVCGEPEYYEASRLHYRAGLQAAFGYDDPTAGSHAGITDTAQMLFIRASGIRKDQIKPWGGPRDSGVSGDPTKSTPELGKMGVEFKVNAGINQYKPLKNPPPQRGGRGTRGAAPGAR